MAKLLSGKAVADALSVQLQARVAALREKGIMPTLGLLRVGENSSDLSYERGAIKRAALVGVEIRSVVLPENADKSAVLAAIDEMNADEMVHGVLLFRPLPARLRADQSEICNRLLPEKDVDGMTHLSCAGMFEGLALGYAPCTPAACMELLDYYGIDCAGKRVAVIGRSLVVGKPLAMLLTAGNATVTVCHTKTTNTASICRDADIIVTAAGALGSLSGDFVRPGQTVIDVAINYDANKPNAKGGFGGIAGDVKFDEVASIVDAITPVPGGIGSVTTSVLMKHVVEAAEKRCSTPKRF